MDRDAYGSVEKGLDPVEKMIAMFPYSRAGVGTSSSSARGGGDLVVRGVRKETSDLYDVVVESSFVNAGSVEPMYPEQIRLLVKILENTGYVVSTDEGLSEVVD